MELPLFATKKRDWTVKPGLDKDTIDEITNQLMNASNTDGLPSFVTFYIHEGYYKISGSAMQVGEHARFDCELLFELVGSSTKYSIS